MEESQILEALRFCKGSVAKRDFVPALTHFHIKGGYVTGYNGRIALSSPIACDLDATPEAVAFVRAIETCEQEVSLSMLANRRLAVRSGEFRANIKCTQEPFPAVDRLGDFMDCPPLLEALKAVLPFVSEDASRPWSMGVLLRNGSFFATNNVVVAQYWVGNIPTTLSLNIPKTTVQELVRIAEEPIGMQVHERSITFYYEGKRFLHSILYSTEWPDIERVLKQPVDDGSVPQPMPTGLFDAIRKVKPFTDKLGHLYLNEKGICTAPPETPDDGASVDYPMPGVDAVFSYEHLESLEGIAQHIDLTHSRIDKPRAAIWFGDNIRGAIMGMRRA